MLAVSWDTVLPGAVAGRQAIVSFPGHVDISNAGQLRDRLLDGLDDVIQEIRDYAFASGDPAPLGTG